MDLNPVCVRGNSYLNLDREDLRIKLCGGIFDRLSELGGDEWLLWCSKCLKKAQLKQDGRVLLFNIAIDTIPECSNSNVMRYLEEKDIEIVKDKETGRNVHLIYKRKLYEKSLSKSLKGRLIFNTKGGDCIQLLYDRYNLGLYGEGSFVFLKNMDTGSAGSSSEQANNLVDYLTKFEKISTLAGAILSSEANIKLRTTIATSEIRALSRFWKGVKSSNVAVSKSYNAFFEIVAYEREKTNSEIEIMQREFCEKFTCKEIFSFKLGSKIWYKSSIYKFEFGRNLYLSCTLPECGGKLTSFRQTKHTVNHNSINLTELFQRVYAFSLYTEPKFKNGIKCYVILDNSHIFKGTRMVNFTVEEGGVEELSFELESMNCNSCRVILYMHKLYIKSHKTRCPNFSSIDFSTEELVKETISSFTLKLTEALKTLNLNKKRIGTNKEEGWAKRARMDNEAGNFNLHFDSPTNSIKSDHSSLPSPFSPVFAPELVSKYFRAGWTDSKKIVVELEKVIIKHGRETVIRYLLSSSQTEFLNELKNIVIYNDTLGLFEVREENGTWLKLCRRENCYLKASLQSSNLFCLTHEREEEGVLLLIWLGELKLKKSKIERLLYFEKKRDIRISTIRKLKNEKMLNDFVHNLKVEEDVKKIKYGKSLENSEWTLFHFKLFSGKNYEEEVEKYIKSNMIYFFMLTQLLNQYHSNNEGWDKIFLLQRRIKNIQGIGTNFSQFLNERGFKIRFLSLEEYVKRGEKTTETDYDANFSKYLSRAYTDRHKKNAKQKLGHLCFNLETSCELNYNVYEVTGNDGMTYYGQKKITGEKHTIFSSKPWADYHTSASYASLSTVNKHTLTDARYVCFESLEDDVLLREAQAIFLGLFAEITNADITSKKGGTMRIKLLNNHLDLVPGVFDDFTILKNLSFVLFGKYFSFSHFDLSKYDTFTKFKEFLLSTL